MGRRKIAIEKIRDDKPRGITFKKRKNGLFKKAYELSVLTGCKVTLFIEGEDGSTHPFVPTEHSWLSTTVTPSKKTPRQKSSPAHPEPIDMVFSPKEAAHPVESPPVLYSNTDIYSPPCWELEEVPAGSPNTRGGLIDDQQLSLFVPSMCSESYADFGNLNALFFPSQDYTTKYLTEQDFSSFFGDSLFNVQWPLF
ncbi:hypothetical protein S40288_09491 [Stachybotrys chartarum IBT 40288]|nr:hypothetical protein S40288_09491 [Stachybotrys chartarum IBT 40288]